MLRFNCESYKAFVTLSYLKKPSKVLNWRISPIVTLLYIHLSIIEIQKGKSSNLDKQSTSTTKFFLFCESIDS